MGKTNFSLVVYKLSTLLSKEDSINLDVIILKVSTTDFITSLLSVSTNLNLSKEICIISYSQQKVYNIFE